MFFADILTSSNFLSNSRWYFEDNGPISKLSKRLSEIACLGDQECLFPVKFLGLTLVDLLLVLVYLSAHTHGIQMCDCVIPWERSMSLKKYNWRCLIYIVWWCSIYSYWVSQGLCPKIHINGWWPLWIVGGCCSLIFIVYHECIFLIIYSRSSHPYHIMLLFDLIPQVSDEDVVWKLFVI